MKINNVIIALLAASVLSGCSYIKTRMLGNTETAEALPKTLEYNFLKPRRVSLDKASLDRLNNGVNYNDRFKYYSANGNECRTISQEISRSVCKVDGQWVESAPVLVSRIP